MLNRTGGLDYRTMFTILNPVIFMVDRFIGLSDLRSSDISIKILVDHCKIEIRSSPLTSVQLFTILCHIWINDISEIPVLNL